MATDPTIAGCLARIQRGDISAVGVLADYLEENNLTCARSVRRYWNKYVEVAQWHETADFSRRKSTKWESMARWRRWLRNRVAKLFTRKWQKLPLQKFV